MKVTKKITTTVIGCVHDNNITTNVVKDFDGGRTGRRVFNKLQKDGSKVFIDSVSTEKCAIELSDELVLLEGIITKVEKETE